MSNDAYEKMLAYQREKYRTDKETSDRVKANSKKRWDRMTVEDRARKNAARRQRRSDPAVRLAENTKNRQLLYIPENRLKNLLRGAKTRAVQSGLPFDITYSDLLPLPEICPVLGIKLNYGAGSANDHDRASLDRFDNSLGYVAGNVVIISKRANWLKNNASPDEIQKIADYVTKSRLKSNN